MLNINKTQVYQAHVVAVDPKTHTATCAIHCDDGSYIHDVRLLAPYTHSNNGQGNFALPENGAQCLVLCPSDGSSPFIMGYTNTLGAQEGYTGGRPTLSAGDQMICGNEKNFIVVRGSGVVEIGATPLSSITFIPVENFLRMTFENMEQFSTLGQCTWTGDDNTAKLEYQVAEASGKSASVIIRAGKLETSSHPTDSANMSNAVMNLEFIVAPEMGGKVFGFHVSNDGNYSVDTSGNAALVVKGSYEMLISDYVKFTSGTNMNIEVVNKLEMKSATRNEEITGSTTVKSGTYKLEAKTAEIDGTAAIILSSQAINISGQAVALGQGGTPAPGVRYTELQQILIDIITVLNSAPAAVGSPLDPTIAARLADKLEQMQSKNVTLT